jgi:hypothetical protein
MRKALELEQAIALMAGDDPRPLLVLRECLTCTGTDDALLQRQADNEKTMLMSRWFHCVKLPANVLEEDHPFHAIFAGDKPAHLFTSTANGSERLDLSGAQSRTELWKAMGQTLHSQYSSKYEKHLKQLSSVLARFDELDLKLGNAKGKLEDVIEKHGPRPKKLSRIQAEIQEIKKAKLALDEDMEKYSTLKLRKKPKTKAAKRS